MTQVLTTKHIAAPPEVVWAYISNLSRIPEWVVGTKKMLSISTKEAGVGTAYRELSQVGPMTAQTNWQITAFSAPWVQTHACRGQLFNAVLTMTLEPQGTGTLFKHLLDVQMLPGIPLFGKLLAWMLRPIARRDMRHSLEKATQIIEHEHRGAGCHQPLPTMDAAHVGGTSRPSKERIIRWYMLVCVVALIGNVIVGQAAATEPASAAASVPRASPAIEPEQLAPAQSGHSRVYLPLVFATGSGDVQPVQTPQPTAITPAPTPTTAPTGGTGDPLPPDLAGTWFSGNLFQQDLYDPSSGHWASPSGLGQMYRFGADGTYTYMGFLHIQNGTCVSDVSVYKRGVVHLTPTALTLQPSIAKTRTVIRCGSYNESITEGPFEPYHITWRVDYDNGGHLKLYIPEGTTTREYYKEGIAPALLGS